MTLAFDATMSHADSADSRPVPHEAIARRAFEIYCERSSHDGRDLDDWLQAEREHGEASAPGLSVRLRIKADRRRHRGSLPFFDRRRPDTLQAI